MASGAIITAYQTSGRPSSSLCGGTHHIFFLLSKQPLVSCSKPASSGYSFIGAAVNHYFASTLEVEKPQPSVCTVRDTWAAPIHISQGSTWAMMSSSWRGQKNEPAIPCSPAFSRELSTRHLTWGGQNPDYMPPEYWGNGFLRVATIELSCHAPHCIIGLSRKDGDLQKGVEHAGAR